MTKKPKYKTVQMYHRWNAGKWALLSGTFACPILPATIVTLINWEEWFNKSSISLPFGFATLLLTVVLAILGVLKSDVVFKKADIALFCLSGFFMCIGLTCLFLASLFSQMGYMWLYVGSGLLGSGTCVVVEKKVFEPNIELYKKLIAENCLDAKSKRKAKKEEQARKDAEEDAKRQAVD